MIETLDGIFETVNYKLSTSIKLYDNDEYEDYPPHWHTTMEIIMPTENIYTVECSSQKVILREEDIALICPCCIHTLFAPPDRPPNHFPAGYGFSEIHERYRAALKYPLSFICHYPGGFPCHSQTDLRTSSGYPE